MNNFMFPILALIRDNLRGPSLIWRNNNLLWAGLKILHMHVKRKKKCCACKFSIGVIEKNGGGGGLKLKY